MGQLSVRQRRGALAVTAHVMVIVVTTPLTQARAVLGLPPPSSLLAAASQEV